MATSSPRARRSVLLVLLAILILAAALRLFWIDRYPAGWHHDEALMGVMAGQVYRGEDRPLFFQQYLGQEPLYIYLAAGTIALLGGDEGVLPLRITSVALDLVIIALAFALGRALFGTRVGLLSAALTAVSFWEIMLSRMGYRAVTQPVLESLSVLLLWQAMRRGSLPWYALAGAALGGAWYTYLGARGFPGVFVVFAAWLLLTRGRPTRRALLRAGVLAGAATLVIAPLGVFFLTHPGTFSARMDQVFIFGPGVNGGNPWPLVAESAGKILKRFTIEGEPMWRWNILGRPTFVGPLALAFYGGLIVLLRRLWRRDDASALILSWLAVMAFPALLSYEPGAYNLRAVGLAPALFIVPALGLDRLWRWIAGWRERSLAPAATAVLVLILALETGWTVRDYFVVWAPSFGAWSEGHADAVAQARFLVEEADPADEDVFVASEYLHSPILAQLARPVYPALRWLDGDTSVVFSPESGRPALYVLAWNGLPPAADRLFPPDTLAGSASFAQGVDGSEPPPLFLAYRLTPEQIRARVDRLRSAPGWQPVAGKLPDLLRPLGARISDPVQPGETLPVTLLWQVEGVPPAGEYRLLVHLVDHQNRKVSGHDALAYPVDEWRVGDVVWSRFSLPIPADAEPGRYEVQLGLYDLQSGRRLPVAGSAIAGDALRLGSARIIGDGLPAGEIQTADARFEAANARIELLGSAPPRLVGNELDLTLFWQAAQTPDQDYTVFVQMLDAAGRLVAQSDSYPAGGALPTSAWLPNEIVRDRHRLTLPPNLPAGTYRLIAGLYLLETGERLPAAGGGDFARVGRITMPPPSGQPAN